MLIEVRHKTTYRYEVEAKYAIQSLRLTPRSFPGQKVHTWTITAPGLDKAAAFVDGFGNIAALTTLREPHLRLEIEAAGLVETEDRAGVVTGIPEPSPARVYLRETDATRPCARMRDLAQTVQGTGTLDRLHQLMQCVHGAVRYEIGATHVHTSASDALADGRGVCQDHAHVFITAARVLGIPARYVNGYFISGTEGPSEAHHAWAEAWVNGLGWVGFDPSNLTCPTERYVRLACGLDAATAAPIRGLRRGGSHEALDVVVEVEQQGGQQ